MRVRWRPPLAGAAGRVLRNGRRRPFAPAIIRERVREDPLQVLNFRLLVYKLRRGSAQCNLQVINACQGAG